MSWRIHAGLERCHADTAEGVEEAFAVLALGDVGVEDASWRLRDFRLRHGRTDDLADRGIVAAGGAAERDLVPLLPALVDAEDADVTDGMVAATVHAARHLELDLAEIVEIVEAVEALVD